MRLSLLALALVALLSALSVAVFVADAELLNAHTDAHYAQAGSL